MTDLPMPPPVPDEAVEAAAAVTATHLGGVPIRLHPDRARDLLEAAWPILYATALRHAADEADRRGESWRDSPRALSGEDLRLLAMCGVLHPDGGALRAHVDRMKDGS